MEELLESLERTLQRPLLAKSRTLPSIPQSPAAARVHRSNLIGGSPPGRTILPSISHQPKACTLPPAETHMTWTLWSQSVDPLPGMRRESDDLDSLVTVCRPPPWHEETHMTWTLWSQSVDPLPGMKRLT
ncbi:unnamed protein product [Boreogadus saida]